ncbi:MAG: hydantoinase B/oxoprolinase family protein [Myxococcota bacterium]
MTSDPPGRWEFWVDRGGTFTDCIGVAPGGALRTAKVLSSDTAPVEGIRRILEREGVVEPGAPLPPCTVKLGSTVATNALLERRGAPTLFVTQRGLGDLMHIGTQERPELFDLAIRKPPPLCREELEIAGRLAVDGQVLEEPDFPELLRGLRAARERGIHSVAVALAHSYAFPEPERRVAECAREAGVPYVALSSEVAREIGLLARAETTAADAYLTPLLRAHVAELSEALPESHLRFMQSSGGLTDSSRFRGPNALLSGPAGGVVAAARVAARAGHRRAIGFDMGGTSTDVSLIVDGEVERSFESLVGGIRVKAPMLRIHTVAAGGGSLCRFDGFRLTVGPESAGALPGPLCYGRPHEAGDGELALTDVNFHLGRVQGDFFPFELEGAPVERALERLSRSLEEAGTPMEPDAIAAGFVAIANASMAQAIAQVSVARGVDPRDFVLVGFGGAGGQHVCAIARALGMAEILLHPLAGLLSAHGIGHADITWDGQQDVGRPVLGEGDWPEGVREAFARLEREGREALLREGAGDEPRIERWLDLRYAGTDVALAVREPEDADWLAAFAAEHSRRFGYTRDERPVEIAAARVRAIAGSAAVEAPAAERSGPDAPEAMDTPEATDQGAAGRPTPARSEPIWFPEIGRRQAPVYLREQLAPGDVFEGPALVLEPTGTVVVDPGFHARIDADGVLRLRDLAGPRRPVEDDPARPDPVRLEVFGNRFMSIAEQMGAVLRNTAFSTNIKERLDYSCAVFDGEGGLVANAPHIPVHLGAMGETVRVLRERFPDWAPGEVVVTNDPFAGGSHLPDVTVVTPVFAEGATAPGPGFFVASRGHHADLGGTTPGSMPPDSTRLADEGVVIHPLRLVRDGRLDEAAIRELLSAGPHPARRPDDNVADLEAMVAANRAGERLVQEFVAEQGLARVARTMGQLQAAAAAKVAREIGRLPDGEHRFDDALDDGTPVCVRMHVAGERLEVDFEGTGPASSGNLNAPPAVVQAAVLYALRCLVAERIPLNGGCLVPVSVRVPEGCLLNPPPGSAVVGGNVETSQRVVDVLLGALGLAAASQGTMNNLTFGDAHFGYYETLGGGAGAGPDFDGASGVHTHMTNTRITDLEVLESRTPVVLRAFALRRGSGGAGRHRGGDGLVRVLEFRAPVVASLLTERRDRRPFGLAGGAPGAPGRNRCLRADGSEEALSGKCRVELAPGDRLVVETPGGGGYGAPS